MSVKAATQQRHCLAAGRPHGGGSSSSGGVSSKPGAFQVCQQTWFQASTPIILRRFAPLLASKSTVTPTGRFQTSLKH